MPTIRTTPWDAADHLNTVDDIVAYLEAALEDGDPQLITAALGDIARSAGMTRSPRPPVLDAKVSTRRCRAKAIQPLQPYSRSSSLSDCSSL